MLLEVDYSTWFFTLCKLNSEKSQMASCRRRHRYKWIPLYPDRALIKASDKLRAIPSIPSHFATTLDLNYIAGLWKEDLHLGLTWFAKSH
jgi:hypothetical protein